MNALFSKRRRVSAGLVGAAVLVLAAGVHAADKPHVHLISTGGTIAGGPAGPLNASNLLERAPEIAKVADVTGSSGT